MIRIASLAAAIGLLASPALAQNAGADATLTLRYEPETRTGTVMVALFDSEAAYTRGAPVRQVALNVASGKTTATFDGLPQGNYAAKAFHDINGNGKMDTNPFGMPVEPYAFSNNAVGNMGPARWDRAHFAVSGDTAQTITIR